MSDKDKAEALLEMAEEILELVPRLVREELQKVLKEVNADLPFDIAPSTPSTAVLHTTHSPLRGVKERILVEHEKWDLLHALVREATCHTKHGHPCTPNCFKCRLEKALEKS